MLTNRFQLSAWAALLILAITNPLTAQMPEAKATALPAGAIRQLGEVRLSNVGHATSVAFSPDGQIVAAGGWDGTLYIYDVLTGKELRRLDDHKTEVRDIVFTPDGKALATHGGDEALHLWNCGNWSLRRLSVNSSRNPTIARQDSIAMAADGKWLASRIGTKLVIWDIATGKERCRQTASGRVLGTSADGKEINFLDYRKSGSKTAWFVTFHSAETGKELRAVETLQSNFEYSVSMRSDKLIGLTWDQTLYYHNLKTDRRKSKSLQPRVGYTRISLTRFSPNNKVFAISGPDETVQVWETATFQERFQFRGLEKWKIPLAFSPDSRLLATGSTDSTVLLWDLTGRHFAQVATPLTKADLEVVWTDLASADAAIAFRAMAKIMAEPESALPFLKGRIVPAKSTVEPTEIQRHIDNLASDAFTVRDRAGAELSKLGAIAESALRKTAGKTSVLETRRRIDRLLSAIDENRNNPLPDDLRLMRAVEALETLGTSTAKELLGYWAQGDSALRLSQEARAALASIEQHSKVKR